MGTPVATDACPQIVETALREVRHIATLPAVALKIVALTEDPQSTLEDVQRVIQSDPALSTRILRVVNSSFYGLQGQIGSIDRAVLLLGLNAVRNIAVAASVHRLFRCDQIAGKFSVGDLWTHSVAVAAGARALAEKTGLGEPDELLLAGLIHDIGIMIELQACRPRFLDLIELMSTAHPPTFRQAEERVLGASHELFGAALCRAWHFPEKFGHVTGFHHRPTQVAEADRALPAIVHVADVLAFRLDAGYTRTVESKAVDSEVLDFLGIDESDLETIGVILPEAIQEAQQILSTSEPP